MGLVEYLAQLIRELGPIVNRHHVFEILLRIVKLDVDIVVLGSWAVVVRHSAQHRRVGVVIFLYYGALRTARSDGFVLSWGWTLLDFEH